MLRKISQKTWDDVREEMSIASDRDKFIQMGKVFIHRAAALIDETNISDIINAQVAVEKVLVQLKVWEDIARRKNRKKHDSIYNS